MLLRRLYYKFSQTDREIFAEIKLLSELKRKITRTMMSEIYFQDGNVACATSTGGITGKRPGRVGDSPLVGCGGYADNMIGAVSTTGHGESITKGGGKSANFAKILCRL